MSAATCGHCGFESLTNPCYRCGTSRVDVTYMAPDGAARRELESRKRIARTLVLVEGLRWGLPTAGHVALVSSSDIDAFNARVDEALAVLRGTK